MNIQTLQARSPRPLPTVDVFFSVPILSFFLIAATYKTYFPEGLNDKQSNLLLEKAEHPAYDYDNSNILKCKKGFLNDYNLLDIHFNSCLSYFLSDI
ncbi:hypothetical protein MUN89_00100 [Halobacillus salinarum]|uniref:Uncharacterized protein n=1 Tax=Halobacillus salinarum TaxID=2932257 RepID=A0ABY4EJ01_9BACI|nr:hypothetical protein [Halobacillus salinarum]UOQ44437.1 hypothetical protein MUN89_00100 [Halobacillus salinarum]